MNWHEYFFSLVDAVSKKSKDRSSKIGCVVVGKNNQIVSTGYNGFPRGMEDKDDSKHERPIKYKYTEHAERNAVYNAARCGISLDGCSLYCNLAPCCDCARAIVQSGIKTVYIKTLIDDCPKRWHEEMCLANDIMSECGVSVVFMEVS